MKPPFLLVMLVVCAVSAPAAIAQSLDDAAAHARIHLGPVALTPTIALTNAGVDNNVFNESDVDHPKSDFTATVTPAANLWMRMGGSWLTTSIREDLVYYQTYASERSVNSAVKAAWLLPLNRLSFRAAGSYLNTRDRPGFEIDERSRHTESGLESSVELRATAKTFVSASLKRARVEFEQDAVYEGTPLTDLNRTMTTMTVSARHDLTPVTALTIDFDRQQDRFEYSPARDSDSTRLLAGLRFGARIGGSASGGYQHFQPLSSDLPDYRGPVVRVDVGVIVFGGTRVAVQMARHIEYSYEFDQPYYVGTGGMLSLTQALYGPFEVIVHGGVEQMAYQGRLSNAIPPDRTDVVEWWGGGVGYRIGPEMRVGLNLDQQQRRSDVAGHTYKGLRIGTSVTYGF